MAAPNGSTSSSANNPTGGTFTVPGAAQTGDLLLFYLYARAGLYDISDISGITTYRSSNNGANGRLWVAYRYKVAGDTTFAFTRATGSSNADVIWGIDAFPASSIFGSGNPFDADTGVTPATGTGVDPDPPALTPLAAGSILWTVMGKRDDTGGSITKPSLYTLGWSNESNIGSDACAGTAYREGLGTSSENPGTWTLGGGSVEWLAWSGVLKPGGGTPAALTPSPVGIGVATPQNWAVEFGYSLLPDPVAVGITLMTPETVVVGADAITLTPDPVILGYETTDGQTLHAVQPEVWAPEQAFSGRLYASGQTLWSGIMRALPMWDTAFMGRSYTDAGVATDYTAPSVTGDDDPGTPELWYTILNGGAETFDLGAFDVPDAGSVFLYVKPLTVLTDGVLFGTADAFEGRWDADGLLYNDAFLPESAASTSTIAVNRWQSLLFTWGSGDNAISVNGADVLNQSGAATDPGAGTLKVGIRDGSTDTVNAQIGAFYVWNRVLTSAEKALISNDPWIMFRQQAGVLTPSPVTLPTSIPAASMVLTRDLQPTPVMVGVTIPTPSVEHPTLGRSDATIPKPQGHKAALLTRTG
jgi:hypothetical protein